MVSTIFLFRPHYINITKFQKVQANLNFFYKPHIKKYKVDFFCPIRVLSRTLVLCLLLGVSGTGSMKL